MDPVTLAVLFGLIDLVDRFTTKRIQNDKDLEEYVELRNALRSTLVQQAGEMAEPAIEFTPSETGGGLIGTFAEVQPDPDPGLFESSESASATEEELEADSNAE